MYNSLDMYRKYIEQFITLNKVEWSILKSQLTIETFKKGETIHHMGDICKDCYFITKGIVRSYTLDGRGKDYTTGIHFNDQKAKIYNVYIIDFFSFINQSESDLAYDVIEDCTLVKITYTNTQLFYKYSKKGEYFGRVTAELAYLEAHNQIISSKIDNAEARIKEFLSNRLELMEKVPQYHIASYLNVSPQLFSTIKNKLTS